MGLVILALFLVKLTELRIFDDFDALSLYIESPNVMKSSFPSSRSLPDHAADFLKVSELRFPRLRLK